jgi:hypothetical protein
LPLQFWNEWNLQFYVFLWNTCDKWGSMDFIRLINNS